MKSKTEVVNGSIKISAKQGRIHANLVVDGWAAAVMQKPLAIQKCDGRTIGLKYQWADTAKYIESRVRG